MRTGGRKDMTKPIVVFRNYANVPKRYSPVGLQARIRSIKQINELIHPSCKQLRVTRMSNIVVILLASAGNQHSAGHCALSGLQERR
jgi:hypothetical protein